MNVFTLDPELRRRLEELGPLATMEQKFQAIHQWGKERNEANRRRQEYIQRHGKLPEGEEFKSGRLTI